FLAIFVKHLICVMKSANEAVISMKKTLDTTNRQLETLDKPLNTLNELSETVDCVHEASKTAVRSTIVTVIENFSSIKDWVMSVVSKDKTNGKTPADEEGE
ncbi:MAG: histidine kinase, partial [Longicatena sp.]